MKQFFLKLAGLMKTVFGYGIMICLIVGGLSFFGYLAAICIGGETATQICTVIYKQIYPVLVVISTSSILLGLISMYITGDTGSKKSKKADADAACGDSGAEH